MKINRLKLLTLVLLTLFLSTTTTWAATISGNVADYNAAQVLKANGVLVAPAGVATYTATSTLPSGSSFKVALPAGFIFGSAPVLTTSGTATFALSSGGAGSQSATFTIQTADVASGQTISLASFIVNGATALATVTPVANALPLTLQAIGTDTSPIAFGAFASDAGATAVFVGAIQFVDLNPPSLGTEFGLGGAGDSLTVVYSAIEIAAQTFDAATSTVPILSPNGLPNTLSPSDTATVTVVGNTGGLAAVFQSSNSSCSAPTGQGYVNSFGSLTVPNVPIGHEVFFCVTGSGAVLQSNPNGLQPVTVSPGASADFLSINANVEFPGLTCYNTDGNYDCAPVPDLSTSGYFFLSFFFN